MNVRIFWVLAMECMCAQTRPWFILSSGRVLGSGVRTLVNSMGKITSTGGSEEGWTRDTATCWTASPTHYHCLIIMHVFCVRDTATCWTASPTHYHCLICMCFVSMILQHAGQQAQHTTIVLYACVCLICMVSYMHVFCIFVFAPVQLIWACFTWNGALEIRSLLLLPTELFQSIYNSTNPKEISKDCSNNRHFFTICCNILFICNSIL